MQTADFDYSDFDAQNQPREDDKLLVKFFLKQRPDSEATIKEGRPIYRDVEYIDIRIPGSRTGGACRPASPKDKQRFARHYAAFKQRQEVPLEGTPLSEWPMITRTLVEELTFHNVKTVEHLAEMNDTHVGKFMGLGTLKVKAKAWLEQAGEKASEAKLIAQLAERDERIEALEQKVELLLTGVVPKETLNIPDKVEESAPSLHSELDNVDVVDEKPVPKVAAKAKTTTKARRRRRVKTDNGTVQDSK